MKHPNKVELVDEALSSLPSIKASESFTEWVLEALEERRGHRPVLIRVVSAMAASVILAALLLAGLDQSRQRAAAKQFDRTHELRVEHRLLRQELVDLSTLLEQDHSVVYLGGDEQVDLVLDLGSFAEPVPWTAGPSGTPQFASETHNN